ncbi:ABC transporter substrate-binding protein [Anoxybacillus ayderensis]|uniref:ABC transporter substrate-binding protein n=1 Tax=unclassified Anoxybacillus TaxID=2639704 RepID=UPI00109FAB19|nr:MULTISPECIES: extracellular solute-binding protein [unclassified Anoxybacillus]MBW9217661.1 extracellular solute-binding protein [Anoxybacillus sp. ST70]NNU95760.1 extracellular solute-binding protein [Anoxybacillus sp. EFIL]THD16680.1 ABC transporter substrate-binding protein [Anoxybacillus ayderensis]
MKRKRIIVFGNLIASMILLFLVGCKAEEVDEKDSSSEKVKIEFFHYKSEAKDTFDELISKFEKENPNIDVVNANPPDAETVLKTRVAKRDIPDIVAIGANSTFAELSKAGVFVDVTNATELDSIQPAYIDMLRDVTGLEKVYAIPYAANADGIIYNKTIFNELGLTVPKTWDELIAVAEKVKAAGKTPFYFTFKDAWTTLPVYNALAANTQGENFFDQLNDGKTTFQKGYKEATEKFVQLLEYGHKDNFGKGYADGNVAFAKGESAMYLQGIWAIPEIRKANPDIELGVFPYPATNDPENTKLVSGVDLLLAISKTSKHPEEARKFVNFLLDPENAKFYLSEQNAFSAIKGITQEDPALDGLKESFEKGALVDFPDHYIPLAVGLEKLLQQLTHDKDVEKFLKNLDAEWEKVQGRK